MNIIIHGTKGGYRVLYSTPNSPLIAEDSRSAASSESVIGQSAYSITFAANGCVLTKFMIVRDMIRNMATGNIAFSIYLPNNQKLTGSDVKSLLDQLSSHYCRMYAPDNNLENVYEDWSFVKEFEGRYSVNNVSADDVENIQQGTGDAAFVYYESADSIQKYFDAPYQEENSNYKQIFFVEKRLEGRMENPLNALKHNPNANLTGKIDLDNPKYKLLFNEQAKGGVKIEVKVKGNKCYNKNRIRKKDVIEISYSKDYHETQQQQGRWDEISPLFIDVNDNEQTITIKEIALQPRKKIIPITVVDKQSKKTIPNFHVVCKRSSRYSQRKDEIYGQVVFEGSEIGESWHIEAMADGYKKEEGNINPENVPEIVFNLTEQKIFTIEVRDHKTDEIFSPGDYDVTVSCNRSNPQYHSGEEKNKIVFTGDEIGKEWYIEIRKKGFEQSGCKPAVCPRNQDVKEAINIYIEKKQQETINDRCADGNTIISLKLFIVFGLVATLGVMTFCFLFKGDKQPTEIRQASESQIRQYIEGDSLFLKILESYKRDWEKQKPEEETKNKIILYNPMTWLVGNEQQNDSSKFEKWKTIMQNMELAIKKRILINKFNFIALINLQYYSKQEIFKSAILKIDSVKYNDIKTGLGDISALTLNQIADSINAILTLTEVPIEQKIEKKSDKEKTSTAIPPQAKHQPIGEKSEEKTDTPTAQSRTPEDDLTTEITNHLRGGELKRESLQKYESQVKTKNQKKSIVLALKFWSLNGTKNNSYSSYQGELNKDNDLKNSDLKRFVDTMCQKERPKYVANLPKSDMNKDLTHIKGILQ